VKKKGAQENIENGIRREGGMRRGQATFVILIALFGKPLIGE